MNAAMSNKLQMINEYIDKLEKAILANSESDAESLQKEIIAIFGQEILGLRDGLDHYSWNGFFDPNRRVDFIGDAKLLKSKLTNYRSNLKAGLIKTFGNGDGSVQVTQTVQQDMKNTITITLEQALKNVNNLPNDCLSNEDKDILCGKLATLSAEQNKESKWESAKGILKWIAEKGIEVGIAALPYIAGALND